MNITLKEGSKKEYSEEVMIAEGLYCSMILRYKAILSNILKTKNKAPGFFLRMLRIKATSLLLRIILEAPPLNIIRGYLCLKPADNKFLLFSERIYTASVTPSCFVTVLHLRKTRVGKNNTKAVIFNRIRNRIFM